MAREHFGGSLAGRLVASAGLGGMGSAQPLAITRMLGGVCLIAEVDREKADRRRENGSIDLVTDDLDSTTNSVWGSFPANLGMETATGGGLMLQNLGVVPSVEFYQGFPLNTYLPPNPCAPEDRSSCAPCRQAHQGIPA